MSKDSKQTSTSNTLQLPKAPDYITDSLEGLTGAIMNLGQRNPQDYVSGASPLQSQAFNMASGIGARYGATPVAQYSQPNANSINLSRSQSGGGGLFDSLGVRQPETTNYDWQAIADDRPDIQSAFNSLTPQQHADIARVTGNPDGVVNVSDFARFQIEANGPTAEYEQRMRELSGLNAKGSDPQMTGTANVVDMGGGRFGSTTGSDQLVQMGTPTSPPSGTPSQRFDPMSGYQDAAQLTQLASTAGANTVNSAALYSPTMSGSAGVSALQGYDAANTGAAQIGDTAQWSPAMLDAKAAYDAALGASSNFQGGSVQAQSLLDNLQDYMSPYTNDVVDTTLAGFDVEADRTRAAQAAAAAGSGANRGTRNSIFEAVLEGELARERAGTESGLRDQAFNTGAGLSNQDADRRQSASETNAQLAQQAALARQEAELQRANMMFQGALSDQSALNSAGQFNAGNENTRTLAQAGYDQQANLANMDATNQARAFGADAANTETLTQAGFDQQTNLANQSAANTASQFNASTINDLNSFNASQADTALNRTLQGAGQLANISNTYQQNERADTGLLAELGAQEREIDMQQRNADIGLLSTISQLFGSLPFDQVTGVSSNGSQTTTSTPGLLDWVNAYQGF